MRLSSILLVAAAVLLTKCDAVSTTSEQTKISSVNSVQSASIKNSRFLRTVQTETEDDDDDEDLDSEEEERMGMPSFLTKLLGQGDDAAAAAKKLQPQQVAKLSKVDDVKVPNYKNNPLLMPEGEALAVAKKIEAQWKAQLSKTDQKLLKRINDTPGAAQRISAWRQAEWDPTQLAQFFKNNYKSLWMPTSSEKKAWDLYAAMYLRKHFSLNPSVM